MKRLLIILTFIITLGSSCKKILEPSPADTGQSVIQTFYINYNGALQGVNGIYAQLREPYKNMWWVDVMSDDTKLGPGGDQNALDFEDQSIQPNSGVVASLWASHYSLIYRANVAIDRIPLINGLQGNQEILRKQLLSEAYFLRALGYFNLVRLYGDVPLIITELKNTDNLSSPRNSTTEVYNQIEKDLLEAIKYLPVKHPNPTLIQPVTGIAGGTEVGRATLGSAKTLLANLYLLTGKSALAEVLLQDVVNSNQYNLSSTYSSNYNALGGSKNNSESVFEVQYATPAQLSGASHDFSYQFGPIEDNVGLMRNRPTDNSLTEDLTMANTLVQAFPTGDLRKNSSVKYSVTAPIRSIAAKYWVSGAINQGSINWPVYRFSEVILLLAEALQNQGKDVQALVELNKIRANARTGISPLIGLSGNSLRDAIRLERRLELNLECKRWFDLQRWGILESVMTSHGKPVKPNTKGLLPIPQGEIDKNSKFVQNAGY